MITKEKKEQIIKDFQINAQDTGSSSVQIAVLSADIEQLKSHFEKNKKDFSSKRGLMKKIMLRRSLLDYLKRTNEESYKNVIQRLGLRK